MLVVGAGSIGTLFAAEAARRLVPTTLLIKSKYHESIKNGGGGAMMIRAIDGTVRSPQTESSFTATRDQIRIVTEEDIVNKTYDVVLLACKHFDIIQCSQLLQTQNVQTRACVTLSNGLGCVEEVVKGGYTNCEEILPAVTYAGAKRRPTATKENVIEVERTGQGETIVQEPRDRIVRELMSKAIPQVRFVQPKELDKVIWKKLLANCCINPLTAILGIPNGQVPQLADALLDPLCDEFMRVCPVELDLGSAESAKRFVHQVCANTAPNTSSMLADVLNHRRTEIEALNGALLRFAEKNTNQPLATHRAMYELVKAIERKNGVLSGG